MASRRSGLIALGALVAVVAPAAALGASARDTYTRRQISFRQPSEVVPGKQDNLSVALVTPGTWSLVRSSSKTHMSFHQGSSSCRYSITFTTRLAEDSDETPSERVEAALPVPASAYVLDQGTRGSGTAWRVTRLKTSGQRVQIQAIRVTHQVIAVPVQRGWQETVVSATSRTGDECHSGTYRDTLGPQIGDVLATASGRGRAY